MAGLVPTRSAAVRATTFSSVARAMTPSPATTIATPSGAAMPPLRKAIGDSILPGLWRPRRMPTTTRRTFRGRSGTMSVGCNGSFPTGSLGSRSRATWPTAKTGCQVVPAPTGCLAAAAATRSSATAATTTSTAARATTPSTAAATTTPSAAAAMSTDRPTLRRRWRRLPPWRRWHCRRCSRSGPEPRGPAALRWRRHRSPVWLVL